MKKYRFRRWLRNWLSQADNMVESDRVSKSSLTIRGSDEMSENPIRMNVYPASGGFVVETKTYDRQRDRHNTSLYIVTDGNNLGEELGKIVTMTALSR